VRIPTFSRQSGTDSEDEHPTAVTGTTDTTPVRERSDVPAARRGRDDTTVTDGKPLVAPPPANPSRPMTDGTPVRDDRDGPDGRDAANRDAKVVVADGKTVVPERPVTERPVTERTAPDHTVEDVPVRDDRKPRASVLATLGLILSVVSALLVLSGPLLGYGIGLAVLALILSLGGISATGSRHIAGKTDALIGMILSLGAIVVGVLALTGSLSWLGTDMHPVTSVRHWLDTQFIDRF
jgi:hypothetical protein